MSDNELLFWSLIAFFSLIAFVVVMGTIRTALVAKYTGKEEKDESNTPES